MTDPVLPIYDETKPRGTWQRNMARLSILAGICTVVWLVCALVASHKYAQQSILILAALWAVLPPAWFFYEYFFVYPEAGRPGTWEAFKYGQQVAVALWAGITATLYGLGSSELAKPEKVKLECTLVIPTAVPVGAAASGAGITLTAECPKR